jgi:thermolabile hemolysin
VRQNLVRQKPVRQKLVQLVQQKPVQRGILSIVLACLTFLSVLACAPPQVSSVTERPIDEVYVFGDSLSDTGSVFEASGGLYPPDPPYFQGRYSNGRVWIEYLTDRLQLAAAQIHNLAYGGATTGLNPRAENSADSANFVPSLVSQVAFLTQANQRAEQTLNPDALYVLWAGANDYLQGGTGIPASVPVANITEAIESLINLGAQRFLVANLPDLGQLPGTRDRSESEALSTLTQTHNQQLQQFLISLSQQDADLQVVLLDVEQLYQEVLLNPDPFGFTNATDACFSSSQGICDNPDRFLFWDSIHPTTTAHRRLADTAFTALEANYGSIPLV